MGFWDVISVAGCRHPRWLDDEPDEMGDRTCAVCEQRVRVVFTEAAFWAMFDELAKRLV
jgi:hypothetical protein